MNIRFFARGPLHSPVRKESAIDRRNSRKYRGHAERLRVSQQPGIRKYETEYSVRRICSGDSELFQRRTLRLLAQFLRGTSVRDNEPCPPGPAFEPHPSHVPEKKCVDHKCEAQRLELRDVNGQMLRWQYQDRFFPLVTRDT